MEGEGFAFLFLSFPSSKRSLAIVFFLFFDPETVSAKGVSALSAQTALCFPFPSESPRKHFLLQSARIILMERGLPNLPFEIVFDILSRLPVKSLCRFNSVSKPWLALITHPDFIESHLNRSIKYRSNQKVIIDPPWDKDWSFKSFHSIDCQTPDDTVAELEMPWKYGVKICGSFNGVILLDIDDELCLWNPSIRMHRKFSPPEHPDDPDNVIYVLGYDYVSDDFKVVAVVLPVRKWDENVVYVYSSKLSLWKRIGAFRGDMYVYDPRCILNGSPHWFMCADTGKYLRVVYFDVTEEKIKELPMPFYEVEYGCSTLAVLGGWLCVVDERRKGHCDVLVMKEYGVKESWTKLFDIPHLPGGEFCFHFFQLLCLTKGGEVIMKLNFDKLVIYNPKQNAFRNIGIPFDSKCIDVTLWVESLVSPHGCKRY